MQGPLAAGAIVPSLGGFTATIPTRPEIWQDLFTRGFNDGATSVIDEADSVRLRELGDEIADLQEKVSDLSKERAEIVMRLSDLGWSQTRIAATGGLTVARIGQILRAGRNPARTLLGHGTLTIAVGGKWENGRKDPSQMVSVEALAAYHAIADTARKHGLDAIYRVVSFKTQAPFERPNLVVICSPRLIVNLTEVLQTDPHLRFATEGNDKWHLIERSGDAWRIHRSPCDEGIPGVDLAYIGRLPRPDGKGLFLYLAGIHAPGTRGAADYFTSHLDEIYQRAKDKPWSAMVRVTFDPDTREIISTELASPFYVREGES